MKSRISHLVLACALVSSPMMFQGCYGRFGLTTKLLKWNGTMGDRWINSIVMWALIIVPVYPVVSTVDFLILNTVEFWTGKNPVSMAPGESETRRVSIEGNELIITATQNRLSLSPAAGGGAGPVDLTFDPEQNAWYAEHQGEKIKIAEQDGESLAVLLADGRRAHIER